MRLALAGTAVSLASVGADSGRYNLALGLLEAYVRERRDDVAITRTELPISLDEPSLPAATAEQILASDPEVIGISSACWDLAAFEDVIGDLRRRSPSVQIVLGGPSATFSAQDVMARTDGIDVAVLGDGEETLLELLRVGPKRLADVPGLMYRDGDALRLTAPRPPVDLGAVPSPYLTGTLTPPRGNLMLECSRGCAFRCKYCAWKNYLGALRHVPADMVRRELAWARERDYWHAFILDSAINFDTKRMRALTDALRAEPAAAKPAFSYFISHTHFDDEQAACLDGIPTHEVYVGLESVSPRALKAVGRRPLDRVAFERVLDGLGRVGRVVVSIILGIPGDTLDGFRETVEYVTRLSDDSGGRRIAAVRVFWMMVPPGTFFAERRAELGMRIAARGAPYMLGCESFPAEDVAEAFRFLETHPRRSLLLYDDASPARHLPGLDGPGPRAQARSARGRDAVTSEHELTLDGLRALLPTLEAGRTLPGGWKVEELALSEGRAAVRVRSGGRAVTIQFRRRSEGGPHFVRTKTTDILSVSRGGGAVEPGVAAVMQWLAAEIRKSET